MYIFTHAIKNLGRNKGRNIMMAFMILLLIATSVVAIVINRTSTSIIDDYKSRFGSKVAIDLDYDKLATSSVSSVSYITTKQSIDFAESEYLLESSFDAKISAHVKDIHVLDEENAPDTSTSGAFGSNQNPSPTEEIAMPNMTLIASSRKDISDEFVSETRKLTSGKYPINIGECMISEQLATLNKLKVGDSLKLQDMGQNPKTYTLKISGIFTDHASDYPSEEEQFPLPWNNRHNEIFVNMDTILDTGILDNDNRALTAIYTLKNPSDLKAFQKELKQKGLPEYYKVTTDEVGYQSVVGPVEEMSSITSTFLIVILVMGAIILSVLSTMSIRERKYEIGVLRAMGMRKSKISISFLFESLIITSICLLVGLGIGNVVAQPVADTLLEKQIEIANEAQMSGEMQQVGGAFSEQEEQAALSQVHIAMDEQAILYIMLVALGLATISSLSGIMYITRYEPMKILVERN